MNRFSSPVLAAALAFSCAGQAPPGGGLPDTTPPSVKSTYPEANSTNFRDDHLVFEFSEYVDKRSVQEAIFFSPSVGSVEIDWSGAEVKVKLEELLRADITYVVTLGTDVVDIRNANRMAESFTLAFSTGSTIDSAFISGQVFDKKPEGVTIFSYLLDHCSADTLDPQRVKPDYVTQTGKDGTFTLSHLAWGTYRLFAVRDEYKNLLYVPQVDQIGFLSRDIPADRLHPNAQGVYFMLTKEDTTKPFLLDAQALDKNLIRIRFNEPLDQANVHIGLFQIRDTLSSEALRLRGVYSLPSAPMSAMLMSEDLDSLKYYHVEVNNVRDTAGNIIKPHLRTTVFRGSSTPDTTTPKIQWIDPTDSTRDVPYWNPIDLNFDEPIRLETFERSFVLSDSSGRSVVGRWQWRSSTAGSFVPSIPLEPKAKYTIRLPLDSLVDLAGNNQHDSTFHMVFQTIDVRKLGSLFGRIEDASPNDRSPIVLTVRMVGDKSNTEQVLRLENPGPFVFDKLVEGLYTLRAFRDTDGNGKFTNGSSFPYHMSERFTLYPDTVKIRARWPLEGIVLRFEDGAR